MTSRGKATSPTRRAGALLTLSLLFATTLRAQDDVPANESPRASILLQEAFFHEAALNDGQGALERYERVLAMPDVKPEEASVAHLRKGLCLRLRGDWRAAAREFETVLERFPQSDAATVAGRHVSFSARYLPERTQAFFELVELGQQVEFFKQLIRGTPLENPIDVYLGADASGSTPRPIASPELQSLRAFLNLEFLNQLKRIHGFAIGLTDLEKEQPGALAVFLPGTSSLSRGVITVLMSLFFEETAGTIEGVPVFRMSRSSRGDQVTYIAMTAAKDVVFLGSPFDLVQEAIERYMADDPTGSLASLEDFQEAQVSRSGSLLFSYLQGRSAFQRVLDSASRSDRENAGVAAVVSGLEHLEALSFTLSRSGADLRIALNGRLKASRLQERIAHRPPVLDRTFLEALPANPFAFAAVPTRNLTGRLRAVRNRLTELESATATDILRRVDELGRIALADGSDELEQAVATLDHGALIFLRQPEPGSRPPAYFLVRTHEAGNAPQASLDLLLARLVRTLGGMYELPVTSEFESVSPSFASQFEGFHFRRMEISPSWSAYYAHSDGWAIAALDAAVLREALEAFTAPQRFDVVETPVGTRSLVYLQPARIVQERDREHPSRWEQLLFEMPRATLYTVESGQRYSIELSIPEATPMLRSFLQVVTTPRRDEEPR